jgi:hypothetical protein
MIMKIKFNTVIKPFLLSDISKYFRQPMEESLEHLDTLACNNVIYDHDIEKVVGKDDYFLSISAMKGAFSVCGKDLYFFPKGYAEFYEDSEICFEDENMAFEEPYHAFIFFLATENYRKARGEPRRKAWMFRMERREQTHSENSEDKIEVAGSPVGTERGI